MIAFMSGAHLKTFSVVQHLSALRQFQRHVDCAYNLQQPRVPILSAEMSVEPEWSLPAIIFHSFFNSLLVFEVFLACVMDPHVSDKRSVLHLTNVLICIGQLLQISTMLLTMTLNGVFQFMMTSKFLSFLLNLIESFCVLYGLVFIDGPSTGTLKDQAMYLSLSSMICYYALIHQIAPIQRKILACSVIDFMLFQLILLGLTSMFIILKIKTGLLAL